jgi:hypothetical protein
MRVTWVIAVSVAAAACGSSVSGATSDDISGGTTCGAAGTADACVVRTVATALGEGIEDLKVDATNAYLANTAGQIVAVPLAGGRPKILYTVSAAYNDALALALDSTHVYFAGGGVVGSVPKTGGNATILVSGEEESLGFAATSSALYWAESFTSDGPASAMSGVLHTVSVTGGSVEAVASGLPILLGLVTDGTNLYWLGNDTIESVPVGGGTPTVLASNVEGQSLATDGVNVYWAVNNAAQVTCGLCGPTTPPTSMDSSVYAVPVGGGTPSLLAHGYEINSVAVDGADLYWFDSHTSTLSFAPRGGGTPTVLAKDVTAEIGPVVDDVAIYWLSTTGELMRMPKSPSQ